MKKSLTQILKWLRWPNLIIVFLTMAFIRYGVISPALKAENIPLDLNTVAFLLLCLTTLLITFGGYVINDLFDQETDAKNKGENRAVGVWISASKAWAIYFAVGSIGLLIATYLAWTENKWQWLWIYPLAVFLLAWYSKKLKGSVLWGNLLVSVFCSGVALLLPFAEMNSIAKMQQGQEMMHLLFFYAAFAGTSNLLREIVKDAEDVLGDGEAGMKTLAVKFGAKASRNWAIGIALALGLGFVLFYQFVEASSNWNYGFFLITAPLLLALLFGLRKKSEEINWTYLSKLSKLLMLTGLLGMLFLI